MFTGVACGAGGLKDLDTPFPTFGLLGLNPLVDLDPWGSKFVSGFGPPSSIWILVAGIIEGQLFSQSNAEANCWFLCIYCQPGRASQNVTHSVLNYFRIIC